MATESPIRMPETSGKWAPHKKGSGFVPPSSSNMAAEELKLLLKSHRFTGNGKDSAPNRSGSAPPSMEGSFLAVGNVLLPHQSYESLDFGIGKYESEEQLRADPAYLAYYSANVNLNPRLPPPLTSPEDRWRVRHVGAYGNNKNNNINSNSGWGLASEDDSGNISLRLSQGSLPTHEEEPEDDQAQAPLQQQQPPSDSSVDRTRENLSGQQKVVGGDSQEDFCSRSPSLVYNERSVLTNRVAEDSADRDSGSSSLYNSPVNNPSVILPSMGADNVPSASTDQSSPPAASFSRDRSGSYSSRQSGINNATSRMKALTIIPIPIQEQQFHQNNPNNFSQNKIPHHHQHQQQQANLYQTSSGKSLVNNPYISVDQSIHAPSKLSAEVQPVLQPSGFTPPLYASAAAFMTTAASPYYSNIQAPGFFSAPYLSGYTLSPNSIPPYVSGYPPPGTVPFVVDGTASPSINPQTPGISTASNVPHAAEIHHQNMNKFYGQLGFPLQPSFVDPMYIQYPRQHFGEPYGVQGPFDPMTPRGGFIGGQVSLTESKKGFDNNAYMDEHKIHHPRNTSPGNLNARRGLMNPNYLGNSPNVGVLMQYQTSPLQSPVLPGVFPGSPGSSPGLSRGRAEMRFSPAPGRTTGMYSGWPARRGFEGFDDPKIYNFLEELKSGKGRRFELSDITGHIVEFSSDQHGSRFIQQKLENCSVEEKASVFKEVLPHAPRLMTDVFGNYVIQKFFEYGSPDQRKELAKQLTGQILTLSLQMYGCRVIQKALEVIELDQKAQLVHELDGHVMRCVRDQNGNHVIQKCIESIPTDKIGFIISAFRGQVATLSMHPYGCRVIQRVLEHCTDEVQCQFIIDEILESARTLAQDQYGNYVTQHVLERGESEERRQIISKLSGHIVQLSQHKFASNVIEKCLEHGSPADQEIIINEIVGQDEGNDNLLTMMKDQFANYVVQKTLEICTECQRTVLLSRIRGHAHALKKYTYGKHIVARFEQVFGEDNQSST